MHHSRGTAAEGTVGGRTIAAGNGNACCCAGCPLLHTIIFFISNKNISICIYKNAGWIIELIGSFAYTISTSYSNAGSYAVRV